MPKLTPEQREIADLAAYERAFERGVECGRKEAAAEIERLRAALEPFALCASPFGDSWTIDDEIGCYPFMLGEGRLECLLFTIRVGQFRAAASVLAGINTPPPEGEK